MALRAGLINPVGLTLLVASAILTVAMAVLPVLERLSERAPWMAALGLLAYAATVAVVAWPPRRPSSPELRQVRLIRDQMANRLVERETREGVGERSQLTQILDEAVRKLDHEVLPKLEEVVQRHKDLGRSLMRYERGELPPPDHIFMERLRRLHARQREAIAACVRQAANADAVLLAMMQEGDETAVAREVGKWADELRQIDETLDNILRREEPTTDETEKRQPDEDESENSQPVDSASAKETIQEPSQSSGKANNYVFPDGLTPREVEVLRLIARGKSNKEIATELVVSPATVERHVANIYAKTGAHNRAEAAAYAFHHRLVEPVPQNGWRLG